jgi:hypothetical protein
MLCGKVPFEAENLLAIAMRHISEVASSPKDMNLDVPQDLADITVLLLSKDPLARYGGDALALADDLERVCRGLKPRYRSVEISSESPTEPLVTPPDTFRRERCVRRRSKKRSVVGAATAAALALGLTLSGAYSYGLYELPWTSSTNAAVQKEITSEAPSLESADVLTPPENPQDETVTPVATEAQPVAYTAPVKNNPEPVQGELPAAAPATAEQEAEPVGGQEGGPPAPVPTVGEKKTRTEPLKKAAVIKVTSAREDEKPGTERGEHSKNTSAGTQLSVPEEGHGARHAQVFSRKSAYAIASN